MTKEVIEEVYGKYKMGKTKRIKKLIKSYEREIHILQRNAAIESSNEERIRAQASVHTYMSVCRDLQALLDYDYAKKNGLIIEKDDGDRILRRKK